jgi:hypothetical protein
MQSPPSFASERIYAASEDALRSQLYQMKATDGLPVILPTPERVEAMLEIAAIAGFERDFVLGDVGPNMGQASVEKVAINAVMAGCLPEQFPIVIAAITALCDPRMDLSEIQVTTHQIAPFIIINGPAVRDQNVACSFGALGYGHQANLCIGRAVRLCLINLGGCWPGESAMAILGQPGSVAYCIGEDEASSPFPPLHTTLGFAAEQSAVTVLALGSPVSVIVPPAHGGEPMADRLLATLAGAIANVGNNTSTGTQGTALVILNPDHADVLHREGYDRPRIAAELVKRAVNPAGLIYWLRGMGTPADPEAMIPAIAGPDSVLIMVAGGHGLYSTVMTTWGGGPHKNPHVSQEIIFSDMCEIG